MATRSYKATTTAVLALAATLAGCASSYRNDSTNGAPGAAVRATMASQVANPAAGTNPNPVSGIDGSSARAAIQRYEKAPDAANGAAAPFPGMTK